MAQICKIMLPLSTSLTGPSDRLTQHCEMTIGLLFILLLSGIVTTASFSGCGFVYGRAALLVTSISLKRLEIVSSILFDLDFVAAAGTFAVISHYMYVLSHVVKEAVKPVEDSKNLLLACSYPRSGVYDDSSIWHLQALLVINYDLPILTENYVRRIGRCGRFELKGVAISFVT